MISNPLNLALRFILEIAGLIAMGFWGWAQPIGGLRILLAIAVPLVAAICWGVFRVGAESPRGKAPVPVPGRVRLLIEACFFGFAVWMLAAAGATSAAWLLGAATVLHYIISYRRLALLLQQ